jgi:tetratricopeptide (TPR) repeat protein
MNQFIKILFVLYCLVGISGCEGFLDEKPSKSLVVPNSPEDIQALLDGDALMNVDAFTLFLQSDDFELQAPGVAQLIDWQRNAVFWKGQIDSPTGVTAEYFNIYRKIFVAHFAMEELEKLSAPKSQTTDDLRGQALFYRAYGYFTLAQLFMPDYTKGKDSDMGILPLRSVTQLDVAVPLATVSQLYAEIIKNLEQALTLLPTKAKYQTRPSKVAAYGLLSRVNLAMGEYDKALINVLAALDIQSYLMDYNTINPANTYPIPFLNKEIVFNGIQSAYSFSFSTNLLVNSEIYQSYDAKDLRKVLYFTINRDRLPNFTGSYNGNFELFSGIAVDELMLTAAECLVRVGEVEKGLEYLNRLLVTRWMKGSFVPFKASTSQEALAIILKERRKSLLFRSTRWLDLRRLSNEPSLHQVLQREAGGFSGMLDLSKTAYALKVPARELDFEVTGK